MWLERERLNQVYYLTVIPNQIHHHMMKWNRSLTQTSDSLIDNCHYWITSLTYQLFRYLVKNAHIDSEHSNITQYHQVVLYLFIRVRLNLNMFCVLFSARSQWNFRPDQLVDITITRMRGAAQENARSKSLLSHSAQVSLIKSLQTALMIKDRNLIHSSWLNVLKTLQSTKSLQLQPHIKFNKEGRTRRWIITTLLIRMRPFPAS